MINIDIKNMGVYLKKEKNCAKILSYTEIWDPLPDPESRTQYIFLSLYGNTIPKVLPYMLQF